MGCLLYYITDRTQFPANRRRSLLAKIAEAASCGIDYIQLRERDLGTRELERLAREAVAVVREAHQQTTEDQERRTGTRELGSGFRTRLLINSRTDVALAVGADGVHLRSEDVSATDVRAIWKEALAGKSAAPPIIAASCHTPADAALAASSGADFAVFAAVFGKRNQPGVRPTGLDLLHNACHAKIPVLALGGVTLENAASCIEAGAAGVAGIRLFQENKIEDVVRALRVP